MPRLLVSLLILILLTLHLTGCWSSSAPQEVVVYTALDMEFSQTVFDKFEKDTGVKVLPKFDVESTKTVGLVQSILAEADHPRCDLFWNNEIMHTIRLQKQGLLEVYRPAQASHYPEAMRAADGTWHGFAARARVLLINTNKVPEDQRPKSILDLKNPRWKGQVGLAKPLFGTTATHAACLFALWGEEKAKTFFQDLKANDVQILSGNKQVALSVAGGQLAFGLTDTDDAIIELEKGMPVVIIYPDRAADQMGTLFIPNTLCLLKNSPHPAEAQRLADYLLTSEVEILLSHSSSAQIPLHDEVTETLRVETPRTVKALPINFSSAADQWETASRFLRDEFATSN